MLSQTVRARLNRVEDWKAFLLPNQHQSTQETNKKAYLKHIILHSSSQTETGYKLTVARLADSGVVTWSIPCLNFSLTENFFLSKFFSKNTKFGTKNPHFGENLGTKLKFWAPTVSSVRNLQLSVGKLQLFKPTMPLLADACTTRQAVRQTERMLTQTCCCHLERAA